MKKTKWNCIKLYAFQEKNSELAYPPTIGPIFQSLKNAKLEKSKFPTFYKDKKIVKGYFIPVEPKK